MHWLSLPSDEYFLIVCSIKYGTSQCGKMQTQICYYSIKISQICINLKQWHFFICSMVISLQHLRALSLARKYNSPRTVSVKVLTLPVAAKLTLPATMHVQFRGHYTMWLLWRTILFCKQVVFDGHLLRCHLS